MVEADLKALGIKQDHFGKHEDLATLRRDVLRMTVLMAVLTKSSGISDRFLQVKPNFWIWLRFNLAC